MTIQQNAPAGTFTAYDYITIQAPRGKEALYRDTYSSFGWRDDGFSQQGRRGAELNFTRSRDIRNRSEVLDLQHTAERDLESIGELERSRTGIASLLAYVIGIVGAVVMGFSVFAFEGGDSARSFIVGAVGIALWIIAPATYQAIKVWRTRAVRPKIDRRMDEIHSVCEQASSRLRRVA